MNIPEPMKTVAYTGNSLTGYGLRDYLLSAGVTTEDAAKAHLTTAYETIRANPRYSIKGYRVNPDNPNGPALMG